MLATGGCTARRLKDLDGIQNRSTGKAGVAGFSSLSRIELKGTAG